MATRTTPTPTGKVPGYAVVNLDAQYRIGKALTVSLDVDNLFDRTYATYGLSGATSIYTLAQQPFRTPAAAARGLAEGDLCVRRRGALAAEALAEAAGDVVGGALGRRAGEQLVGRAELDQPAQVHEAGVVGDARRLAAGCG